MILFGFDQIRSALEIKFEIQFNPSDFQKTKTNSIQTFAFAVLLGTSEKEKTK